MTAIPVDDLGARARAAWPGVEVPDGDFAAFVGERLGASPDPDRAVELYLTLACSRGDAAAVRLFEKTFFGVVDEAARRARAAPAVAADARQNLARSMFTGDAPAIATFRGRGDLRGWMRVAAMREVLRLVRQGKRDVLLDDDRFLDALCPPADPELGHLRKMFRGEITEALRRAIASLSADHRALLRRQLEGVTIDELAAEHKVHRATAARWLAEARRAVRDGTRRELAKSLGAVSADADSILRQVSVRLDVSLDRLLGGDGDPTS
jgi:RNA polymerase sigma-70 factor (ECF subfamily)